jgi:hypothetical protein
MIALLDNGQDLDACANEIGAEVGQLLTPLTRYRLRHPERPWAIDNGGFSGVDISAFDLLLEREYHHRNKCLFVVVPDIVASAQRTREIFEVWAPRLSDWPLAYAVQDGQDNVAIPWDRIAFVFIGGSTSFKCSETVTQIIKTAHLLGKKVHAGRVNSVLRWKHFEALGVYSCDGTGISQYSHMRRAIAQRDDQAELFA